MIRIENLTVTVEDKSILNTLNLSLASGSIHALMGPNGSGKSTLAYALMGHPLYTLTSGQIFLDTVDITQLAVDKRAQAGLFLAFQQPVEIPGVSVFNFLKEAHHAITKQTISASDFQALLHEYMDLLCIDRSFAQRSLNCGFSGGEKKRIELLQLLLLKPKVAILDEIDSGLDVDALRMVAQGLHYARKQNPRLALLIITHYPRLLDYIKPDCVHVMHKGSLINSGPASLAGEIEKRGYDALNL